MLAYTCQKAKLNGEIVYSWKERFGNPVVSTNHHASELGVVGNAKKTAATNRQAEDESFPERVQLHGLALEQDVDLVDGTTVSLPIVQFGSKTQVIHTDQGDIQVVHATAEQLAEIQQTHQIQIFSRDEKS